MYGSDSSALLPLEVECLGEAWSVHTTELTRVRVTVLSAVSI